DFVKAVKATGRKQLIIAGVVTDVCVTFPVLSALEEGFEVFVVTDASGTFNETVQQAAWNRMSQAGAQLMNWFSVACELHRDWRNDIEGLGNLLSQRIPNYRNAFDIVAPVAVQLTRHREPVHQLGAGLAHAVPRG
ncbi:isochorismatase family protein, partial [Pandoraea sputorum]|uniref:isochorismatase family protein n=1 Tax=Pandoraea sputorum TaxID=93222 RepID=UPI0035573E1F